MDQSKPCPKCGGAGEAWVGNFLVKCNPCSETPEKTETYPLTKIEIATDQAFERFKP